MAEEERDNKGLSVSPVAGRLKTPGFGKTLQYAFQSLRLRFGRTVIATACIAGGVAFLAYNAFALGEGRIVSLAGVPAAGFEADDDVDFFIGLEEFTAERNVWQRRMVSVVLSLLVAFVGIANSMLMAIKERYREIATLKCLGAANRYIRRLFLMEASLQGLAGSVLGVGSGWGLHVVTRLEPAAKAWTWPVAGVSLALGIVLTLAAAIWPIRQALILMPIEAFRVEE